MNHSALLMLAAQAKDLGGGFVVRRLLPSAQRRSVGPFVFFDHFGPIEAKPEDNHDVRPHPHIGLATVTYLFEGAMQHRDSTGVVQRIEPGAINWMTAGRGVVHSERTPEDLRGQPRRSHGLQLWVALPEADEEIAPSFSHTPETAIPRWAWGGVSARVLLGSAWDVTSPVPTRSPTLYLDLQLARGSQLALPSVWAEERALYAIEGTCKIDGQTIAPHTMVVLPAGAEVQLSADENMRCVVIGGAPLGPRFIWWNFVSSRKERLLQAADAWAGQPNEAFAQIEGESNFIPLPERRPT
jgi:redox-sensitive bicupin YhaK (pirin superfamily)